MKYYVIKTHYIPTEKNTRADAKEADYFSGKAGAWMGTNHPYKFDMSDNKLDTSPFALSRAYTRLCDARRALKSAQAIDKSEAEYGWWIRTSEIVEVEVA